MDFPEDELGKWTAHLAQVSVVKLQSDLSHLPQSRQMGQRLTQGHVLFY